MKIKKIFFGIATFVPGIYQLLSRGVAARSARYCYSVWLRHVERTRSYGVWNHPKRVAELGPGNSLGIGLAALLSGAEFYLAFDVVQHATNRTNLEVFDGLVELFRARADIPGSDEFPQIKPRLESYRFPYEALPDAVIEAALEPRRLTRLRTAITAPAQADSPIRYVAPWNAGQIPEDSTVDMIFSQAVMEHVDDLAGTYAAMRRWLDPAGFVSHQIDFRCHGTADEWNGHWEYSDLYWSLVRGGRPYLINRQPYSVHLEMLRRAGFDLIHAQTVTQKSNLRRDNLAKRFRGLSDNDLMTSGVHILARPSGVTLG